jgi:hypothetical protein
MTISMLKRSAFAAGAAAMVLAGCSQSQLGQASGANPAIRVPRAQSRVRRNKPLPSQLLFLTTGLDTIDIYSLAKPDQPLQTINGLQEGQQQMDVDAPATCTSSTTATSKTITTSGSTPRHTMARRPFSLPPGRA